MEMKRRAPHGLRRSLPLVMGPFARSPRHLLPSTSYLPPPSGAWIAMASLMTHKTLLIGAGVLVALGLGYRMSASERTNDRPDPIVQDTHVPEAILALGADSQEEQAEREALPSGGSPVSSVAIPSSSATDLVAIYGRVLDEDGAPVAGFKVRVEPPLPGLSEMTTSSDGRLSGETTLDETSESELVPTDDGTVVLISQRLSAYYLERGMGPLLVVAPRGILYGTVHGGDGEAVEGASIQLGLPAGFSARFEESVGGAELLQKWSASSLADGSFELAECAIACGLLADLRRLRL